jgi:hypothetical protein
VHFSEEGGDRGAGFVALEDDDILGALDGLGLLLLDLPD